MEIAVIGPGALGGTLAAWLAQDPKNALTLCARTGFAGLEAETPAGKLMAGPTVITRPEAAQKADWVFVVTKTYDSEATLSWMPGLLGPDTKIVIVQNGVEHVSRFAALLPGREVIPAVVDIPSARTAPGRVVQNALGWIVVPEGPDEQAFVDLFAHTPIEVSAVSDWTSRAWSKLCLNCAGAFPALTMRSTGPVWNDEIERLVRGLVEECAAVARAEGAIIDDNIIESVVEGARNAPEGVGNSLYADRMAGRPMEVDARNGVIVRLGAKHGIPTPVNELFVALLNASGSPWVSD
ncbi:MAG: 2-dehydropantoate 2-reductase [Ponticaulis sp.]|nr:2-dehydropantoate 2-reductase [Ponticaulis sp.]